MTQSLVTARPAVVLVSGGLDSATVLALAVSQGFRCYGLSFDYGQRHVCELDAAKRVTAAIGVAEHRVVRIDLAQFKGSALTDNTLALPTQDSDDIPITYVPARNTVFLSLALAWSEVLGVSDIFLGINAVDYSGYPDCRPEFIEAFEKMANLATKAAVQGVPLRIHSPLINLRKADIIRTGIALGVDYGLTVSCYGPDSQGRACGVCDSCRIRAAGFQHAGIADPTRYRNNY